MIAALVGDFLPYIVGAVALIAGFFGLQWNARRTGRTQGRAEVIDKNRKAVDDAKDRERAVKPTGKSDALKRLRDRDI